MIKMLIPSEMSKITILTYKKGSEKLIEKLHESGLMEIERVKNEFVVEGKIHQDAGILASYQLRLERIIEILKNYGKRRKVM